jgi:hypothetical protein
MKTGDGKLTDNPEFGSEAGEHNLLIQVNKQFRMRESFKIYPRCLSRKRCAFVAKTTTFLYKCAASGEILPKITLLLANTFISIHSDLADAIVNCPTFFFPINSMDAGCITYSFSESVEWMRFESLDDYELYHLR